MPQIMDKMSAFVWMATSTLVAGGCGIGVRRDLTTIKPQTVIFDDVCGVQEYHDTLMMRKVAPPEIVSTNELERTDGKRLNGGRTTFAFEHPYQVQTIRRVLRENWSGVPENIMKANRVELEVRWSEKAGVRRVVTTEDAAIGTGTGKDMLPLPYHVCLSELLFGAPLYKTRRDLLGLSPLEIPPEPGAPAATLTAAALTPSDAPAEPVKEAAAAAPAAPAAPVPAAGPVPAAAPAPAAAPVPAAAPPR